MAHPCIELKLKMEAMVMKIERSKNSLRTRRWRRREKAREKWCTGGDVQRDSGEWGREKVRSGDMGKGKR